MTVCSFDAFAVKSHNVTLTDSADISSTSPMCALGSPACISMGLFSSMGSMEIIFTQHNIDVSVRNDNALRDNCLSKYADFCNKKVFCFHPVIQ